MTESDQRPAPEEMAVTYNQVYDEVLSRGLSTAEAHDRAHGAVLDELDRLGTMKPKLRTRDDAEQAMRERGHTPDEWRMAGGGRYPMLECISCGRGVVVGDTHVYGTAITDRCDLRWLKNRADRRNVPAHEHDCEACIFIGCYRLRHPYTDDEPGYEGHRTGVPGKVVTMADIYLSCEGSDYRYIVRYGIRGEYATTNVPARYVLAPMVDGTDGDSDPRPLIEQLQEANVNAPALDAALPYDDVLPEN